jgi:hypothetical protein
MYPDVNRIGDALHLGLAKLELPDVFEVWITRRSSTRPAACMVRRGNGRFRTFKA